MYLYLKTHNKTNLKYLGKTVSEDPHLYQGSGKVWKRHIAKHGYDVTTEILLTTDCKDELREAGLYYSNLWNIVESKEFANLMQESGDGGAQVWSEESRKKLSKSLTGMKYNKGSLTESHKKALSENQKKVLSDPIKREKHLATLRANYDADKASKAISKLKWCNDGTRNYRKESIPEGFSAGKLVRSKLLS
jgi:hypothetical protein